MPETFGLGEAPVEYFIPPSGICLGNVFIPILIKLHIGI